MIPRLVLLLLALVIGVSSASAASVTREVEDHVTSPPKATTTSTGSTTTAATAAKPASSPATTGGAIAADTQPSLVEFGFLPNAFDPVAPPAETPSNPDSSGCIDATNSGEDAANGDAGIGVGGCG
jgi:hypothetical protein